MKGIVKLCYRKVIEASSFLAWDKQVFDDTYKEFYIQAQQFDQQGKYDTFLEITRNIPKAEEMHYLVSTAAVGYIHQLNKLFPDILNTQGKRCIPFRRFTFEIIQSSISNKNVHKVAISFFSDPLIWIDNLNAAQIVVSSEDQLGKLRSGDEAETNTLNLSPDVGIISFKKIP